MIIANSSWLIVTHVHTPHCIAQWREREVVGGEDVDWEIEFYLPAFPRIAVPLS